jgi:hypothetical protein
MKSGSASAGPALALPLRQMDMQQFNKVARCRSQASIARINTEKTAMDHRVDIG